METSRESGGIQETTIARAEVGFFFNPLDTERVRQKLESLGYNRSDYGNPYTQTVYFSQKSGRTPEGGYVRTRRYVDSPHSSLFEITPGSIWNLEGKISGGLKERIVLPADIILQIMRGQACREVIKDSMPGTYKILSGAGNMFPVVATQWLREHYILDDQNRATIDLTLNYFAFVPGNTIGELMGQDSGGRIEWKTSNSYVPSDHLHQINLMPIPPKWHETAIRKMYIEWLSNHVNKNE